jgi:hypothetical protein
MSCQPDPGAAVSPAPVPPPRSDPKPGRPSRGLEIALRSVHLGAMGLVLGGVGFGAPKERLLAPFVVTAVSGVLLAGVMRWSGCLKLGRGAGWALFLKLGLLGLAQGLAGVKLELYLLAVVVASVGSHMPSSWRHRRWGEARRAALAPE